MPSTNGKPTGSKEKASSDNSGVDQLIEQAEAVGHTLREALAAHRQLLAALKQHRKQTKLVRSTLNSLKQLQSIGS